MSYQQPASTQDQDKENRIISTMVLPGRRNFLQKTLAGIEVAALGGTLPAAHGASKIADEKQGEELDKIDQGLIDKFYDISNMLEIDISMPKEKWEDLRNAEPHGGTCDHDYTGDRYDWFLATQVGITGSVFPYPGLQLRFSSVGIKKRSYCGSFSKRKPALALNFGKYSSATQGHMEALFGTKYVTLNNCKQDSSYIRQPLGYRLFQMARLPYSRCNFANVFVNSEPLGLYVNVEPIKEPYVQNNFKGNDQGNLYELERGEDFDKGIMEDNRISFEGFSPYYEKHDLIFATHILSKHSSSADKVVDMSQFVRFFAMEALLKHYDGYTSHCNNTYIYNDVQAVVSPLYKYINFKFIPWGLDQILLPDHNWHAYDNAVVAKIVHDDPLWRRYLDAWLRYYANTIFSPGNYGAVLSPLIDAMVQIVLTATRDNDILDDVEKIRNDLLHIPQINGWGLPR